LSDPKFLREFNQLKPDLVVVVAYGKLFPKDMLTIPPLGFINFHPSLLPKLRGPSPIISAILEGLEETGVSIMKLGEGIDDGPILSQKSVKIRPRETTETLTRKLVDLGKEIIPVILKKYFKDEVNLKFQPKTGFTVCKMIKKKDGCINWRNETAREIDRKIRALNSQFKTFTFIERDKQKKRVNILESTGVLATKLLPGEYKLIGKNLAIGTKNKALLISKIQLEGKKLITAKEFYYGYKERCFVL
jgi:methionyl-tRNA formyltransferase